LFRDLPSLHPQRATNLPEYRVSLFKGQAKPLVALRRQNDGINPTGLLQCWDLGDATKRLKSAKIDAV